MKHLYLLIFLFAGHISYSQQTNINSLAFDNIKGYSAYESTSFIEKHWRLAGNPGYDSSIYHIIKKLQKAGFEEESVASGRFTYRIEKRALKNPAWSPEGGLLFLGDDDQPILDFSSNRNMLAINSFPTKGFEEFEIIHITDVKQLNGQNLKGKLVFTEASAWRTYKKAVVEGGASGLLTYNMPSYLQPSNNPNSIQFGSIPFNAEHPSFSISLSTDARDRLVQHLQSGKNKVKIMVNTFFVNSPELTVIANIKGSEIPEEELVISCHVQEPGANDNATGVGAGIELAETYARLIRTGQLDIKRTISFLWGDEISSTRRYVIEDYSQKRKILWGISLDMVGENTAITGGKFLLEKMPDPSAIWTRGEDQHSEWGAGDVKKEDLFPHYFNDFCLNRMLEVGRHYDWEVSFNPYEGGSDHVPFLRAAIPGLLFWHFTDQFYHTDQDRLDKVSRHTLRNVITGTFIITSTLLNADQDQIRSILMELHKAGSDRLLVEFQESRKALRSGSDSETEAEILRTWVEWYEGAIDSVKDIEPLNKGNQKLADSIKKSLRKELTGYLRGI